MREILDNKERKRQVFKFIGEFIVTHRYAPTLREIGEGVGISKTHAQNIIKDLEEDGRITRCKGKPRTITVVIGEENK